MVKKNNTISVDFDAVGLPRFEDYVSELKNKAEVFVNHHRSKNKKSIVEDSEKIGQFIRKEVLVFCGKKPLVKVLFLN